jgi:NAD(P)-dependent dehydrogenase (short-subunit alcohol dehydrogenase family)
MSRRVAIVTGGAGALGQAVTLRLLADGATVAVPWVVAAERDALQARVPARDRARMLAAECDTTAPKAMADFVTRVEGELGPAAALVTAVGGFAGGRLVETDLATWDRMLKLNLTSAFVAARAVLPGMLARGHGRIVTVASRAVVPPAAGFIAYTVSKAGVIALTQALAEETRGTGVTVNAILPSTMDTPGNRAAMPDADVEAWTPVESVAGAIAFLARAETAHVTGSLVTV